MTIKLGVILELPNDYPIDMDELTEIFEQRQKEYNKSFLIVSILDILESLSDKDFMDRAKADLNTVKYSGIHLNIIAAVEPSTGKKYVPEPELDFRPKIKFTKGKLAR